MAEIKEECGVFGIYDLDGNDVTSSIYYGLTSFCSTVARKPVAWQYRIRRDLLEMLSFTKILVW